MKLFFRFLLRIVFGYRIYNDGVLTTRGPVLLLPNHVSWLDWLLLWCVLDDDWKFVTSSITAQMSWLHQAIMVNRYTFPIDTNSPYAVKRMAEFLQGGGRLVLFPEGRLSRTGSLMKLFDGTGFLFFKTKAKVITCYLRGAKRIINSPNDDTKELFPRVTAHFSEVIQPPEMHDVSTTRARLMLTSWLRDRLLEQQFQVEMEFGPKDVLAAVSATARLMPSKIALEDVRGQGLTYRKIMVGAQLLAQELDRLVPRAEGRIGVLLPNVITTPVLLLALWRLAKVPALLNFSTGTPMMLTCAQLGGIKVIVSSRAFVERGRLDVAPFESAGIQILYLEDLRARISGDRKSTRLNSSH